MRSELASVKTNDDLEGRTIVSKKKILFTALFAVAGYLGYRRYQSGQEERDLWAEATDSVPPTDKH